MQEVPIIIIAYQAIYSLMSFLPKEFKQNIFQITPQSFVQEALVLFEYQSIHNPVYKAYIKALRIKPQEVKSLAQIPFLPIECFKYHQVLTGKGVVERVFESSGTTGQVNSKHYVIDSAFYEQVSIYAFEQVYGSLQDYHILALLPSYLERSTSSLVYMVERFIHASQSSYAGFYLDNVPALLQTIQQLQKQGDRKILLLGVTFALLDLVELHQPDLHNVIVMETGGMKGRRKEIIRDELHDILQKGFQVPHIHAEYGMTELLSQAYSQQAGLFSLPAWCKILLRDVHDPLDYSENRTSGVINFIDLANVDSCAFIATQDLAKKATAEQFQILGRVDNTDIRGCNLMV